MAVPAVIEAAAQNYRFNDKFLVDTVKDLSAEEWRRRPSDGVNHMAWIVGHVVWTRSMLLKRLGEEWSAPWLGQFARGVKPGDAAGGPTPEELLKGWEDVSAVLASALEVASEEALAKPAGQGPPSADGKVSGIVNFLAIHETYHIGQASYLRAWMGHKGLMG